MEDEKGGHWEFCAVSWLKIKHFKLFILHKSLFCLYFSMVA